MAQDPWIEKYGTTPTSPTAPPPPSPSAGQDPWIAKYGSGVAGLTGGPAPVATPSVASQDPWIAKYSSPENGINPESGHDESDRFTQEDPNDNWLQKGWSMANKPLTESLFGWGQYRSGAGGLERGAEKVLSGLTSPLSLLTLAAFAPASIGESVAGTAIKEGLMSEVAPLLGEGMDAAKAGSTVETYAKALGAAKKALVANTNIDEAVTAAGMDPAHYTKIGEFLRSQGLKEDDMLAEGTVRRVAAQGLKKAGVSAAGSVAIAKGAETLVNAGFAYQQIQSAVYSFPRFADLMEHGQYDEAGEYLVTGGAGVLFGGLGAAHSLHSLDTLVPGLNEKGELQYTEANRSMMNLVKGRDEEMGAGNTRVNTQASDLHREAFKLAGIDIPESLQYKEVPSDFAGQAKQFFESLVGSVAKVKSDVLHNSPANDPRLQAFRKKINFSIQAGGDKNSLFQQGDALAHAMGPEAENAWHAFTKDYVKPERTIENIVARQTGDLQLVKKQVATGQENIKSLEDSVSKTSLLRDRAKSPEAKAEHQKVLDEFQDQLSQARDTQESAQKRFEDLKKWEGNPDEALKAHHQDLVRQFYEAKANQPPTEPSPENGTALDEFNRRANLMGHVGRDAQIIQEARPEWFKNQEPVVSYPEKGTEGKLPTSEEKEAEVRPEAKLQTVLPEDMEGFQGNKQATWEQGPRHPDLPDDLEERVEKAKPKFQEMARKTPKEYQHRLDILKGYADAARGLSPEEQAFADKIKQMDFETWAAGSNNNLLKGFIENHLYRDWSKDSGVGNELLAQSRAGNFATNVIQARHRTFQTPLEGFLKTKRMTNYDPVEMVRKNANWIVDAAANRKVVHSLLKSGLTNSRGMPLFLLKGSGNVAEGVDGKPSAAMVNPDKVMPTDITPEQKARMYANGQWEALLATREVIDRTPYVSLDNIPEWTNSVKKKIAKLEQTNPLLGNGMTEAARHKASWEEIGTFVKDRAARSAQYIRATLKAAKADGGRTSTDVPSDIAVTPYITKILHSGGVLSDRDILRASQHADKLETQAEGASSSAHWRNPKEGVIRAPEVGELLRMNKKFIPPELQKYLDEQHDKFAYDKDGKPIRTADGNWDTKGLTKAMQAVEHAANSGEYPQLQLDLKDLSEIHEKYSSVNPISQANARPEAEKLLSDINSRQPGKFQFAPKPGDYQEIDHPAFQNWNFMTSTPDGTSVLAKTGVMVDKSIHNYIVNRLGLETSALRKTEGIGKLTAPILKGGAEAKSLLLSGSPFHVIQEMIRGLMLGINPLIRPNPVADLTAKFNTVRGEKALYQLGVRNGLTIGGSHEGSLFSEGLASPSKLVAKIPVWGPISDEIHSMLFDRYIPALKASAFKKMFDKYATAHPDWEDDAVAEHAAKHVNNAFGGQNWKEMGRSATTQDWFNLVSLAPDWLESEMRFAASTMNNAGLGAGKYREEEGKNFSRQQVAVMAAGTYMMARVLNGLYSGDPHFETPFGLATKDKDGKTIEFGVRTLPGDIMHMASDPKGFLTGRESPFVRTAQELVTGRNQFGQKLTDGEKFADVVSQFSPIGFQNVMKTVTGTTTGTDVGTPAQIAKSSGATASVYRSPAQKLAANLAAERSEEGAMSPQKVAKHRVILKLEEDIKAGRLTGQGLQDMADSGQLDQDSVKNILKVVKETTGLDPENTRLYSRVSRLDAQGAMDVLKDANSSERQILLPLVEKKVKAYLKKSRTGSVPAERMSDPTFLEARKMFPQTVEAPD